jgi:hypothetical protein
MTPEAFKRAWEERSELPLVVFPLSVFEGTGVSAQTRRFLSEAGIPDGAGPFLSFGPGYSDTLETASGLWELSSDFDRYWVIGSDGAGNPIVLCPDDSVAFLDHDGEFEECYINKDVSVLAEAALLCPAYESEEAAKERFIEFLRKWDPRALEEGSFWQYEIAAWTEPR